MNWKADILGEDFKQLSIPLERDQEGENIATLIHKSAFLESQNAILYIHGFNDYFFQKEMADKFTSHGYSFFALDLRKYGRSYLPHQKFNNIRNLRDYYEEIDKTIDIIKKTNDKIILIGHSTGGLILTLYAKDNTGKNKFNGLILNSPFFDFNLSPRFIKKLIPLVSILGSILPNLTISKVLNEDYGRSLHKNYNGEWNYDLDWKPNLAPPVSLGWIRAIHKAQKQLKNKFHIHEPLLVLHSSNSFNKEMDRSKIYTTDAVLSIDDIKRVSNNITGDVQITAIPNGIHDLVLSTKYAREKVYYTIFKWLDAKYNH